MSKEEIELGIREKRLRTMSIILNWFWGILFLPICAAAFMAGIATIMMTDSEMVSKIIVNLIMVDACLFWGTPIITIIAVILSFSCRKKMKLAWSIAIQLLPFIYALFAFCLLLLITRIA